MGWLKPSVSGTSFVAKSESKDQLGALNVPSEPASIREGRSSRRGGLQKGPEQLLPSVVAAPSGIGQQLERGRRLSGDLQKPGPGPSTGDALSTNLLHPMPNLSFPPVDLCQATGFSRAAVLTVGKQAHFLLCPAVAFVLFLEANLYWRTRKSC